MIAAQSLVLIAPKYGNRPLALFNLRVRRLTNRKIDKQNRN
jgi:hypothetical protein